MVRAGTAAEEGGDSQRGPALLTSAFGASPNLCADLGWAPIPFSDTMSALGDRLTMQSQAVL
jgi:hypothetical protein